MNADTGVILGKILHFIVFISLVQCLIFFLFVEIRDSRAFQDRVAYSEARDFIADSKRRDRSSAAAAAAKRFAAAVAQDDMAAGDDGEMEKETLIINVASNTRESLLSAPVMQAMRDIELRVYQFEVSHCVEFKQKKKRIMLFFGRALPKVLQLRTVVYVNRQVANRQFRCGTRRHLALVRRLFRQRSSSTPTCQAAAMQVQRRRC